MTDKKNAPTAPASLVEELREWKKNYDIFPSMAADKDFTEILSRHEQRKEVVLAKDIEITFHHAAIGFIQGELKVPSGLNGKRVEIVAIMEDK